jgi:hypothetical protein
MLAWISKGSWYNISIALAKPQSLYAWNTLSGKRSFFKAKRTTWPQPSPKRFLAELLPSLWHQIFTSSVNGTLIDKLAAVWQNLVV